MMMTTSSSENKVELTFETTALNGLRGLLAVHMTIFHSLLHTEYEINTYAAVHLPWFFLLSGFCLTLSYGKINYENVAFKTDGDSNATFDVYQFIRSRILRTVPVYYSCILLILPYWIAHLPNQDVLIEEVPNLLPSLFMMQSWIQVLGFGLIGPSWTLSTLYFFYLIFPWLLTYCQRKSCSTLTSMMTWAFYWQIIIGLLPFLVLHYWSAYWITVSHPFSRLPVFIIGVVLGILYQRLKIQGDENAMQSLTSSSWLSDIFPYPNCSKNDQTDQTWHDRIDINACIYTSIISVFTILNMLYVYLYFGVEIKEEDRRWDFWIFKVGIFNFLFQLFLVHLQSRIMLQLCVHSCHSYFSRFLRTQALQFLGRVSLALYLVHDQLIYILDFKDLKYGLKWSDAQAKMPIWCCPVHVLASILLAFILTKCIEEPIKNRLGSRKN